MVSTLIMSKPFPPALESVSYLCFSFFHSSYRHPSIPVMELFLASFKAFVTHPLVISLPMGKFSGSFSFWVLGISSSVASICATRSSSVGRGASYYRLLWYSLASSAILTELRSYWWVVPGVLSRLIRSLGFFSLFMADQIPPIFSPWCAMAARVFSRVLRASELCRCFISCARWFSLVLTSSSQSKLGSFISSFRSFSCRFNLEVILSLALLAVSFAVFWRDSLKFIQRIWGFVSSLVVAPLSRSSSFFWSFFPWVMTLSIRGFSSRDGRYHVHLLLPIRGASFGANLHETNQWSVRTADGSALHSKTSWVCFRAM